MILNLVAYNSYVIAYEQHNIRVAFLQASLIANWNSTWRWKVPSDGLSELQSGDYPPECMEGRKASRISSLRLVVVLLIACTSLKPVLAAALQVNETCSFDVSNLPVKLESSDCNGSVVLLASGANALFFANVSSRRIVPYIYDPQSDSFDRSNAVQQRNALLYYDLRSYRLQQSFHAVRVPQLSEHHSLNSKQLGVVDAISNNGNITLQALCDPKNVCPQASFDGPECSGRGACKGACCKCDDGALGPACEQDVQSSGMRQLSLGEEFEEVDVPVNGSIFFNVSAADVALQKELLVEMKRIQSNSDPAFMAGDPLLIAQRAYEGFLPGGLPQIEDFPTHGDTVAFNARRMQHAKRVEKADPPTDSCDLSADALIAVYNLDGFVAENGPAKVGIRARLADGNCPFNCNSDDVSNIACGPEGTCSSCASEDAAGPYCIGVRQLHEPDGSFVELDKIETGKMAFVEINLGNYDLSDMKSKQTKYLLLRFIKRSSTGVLVSMRRMDGIPTLSGEGEDETSLITTDAFKNEVKDERVYGRYLQGHDKLVVGIANVPYHIRENQDFTYPLSVELRATVQQSMDFYGGNTSYYSILLGIAGALVGCSAIATCRRMSERFGIARLRETNGTAGDAGAGTANDVQCQDHGLSEHAIASIPEKKYSRAMMNDDETMCCICLDTFKDGDELKHPHERHFFHKTCLEEWLRASATCPLCRAELTSFENGSQGAGGATSLLGRISNSLRRSFGQQSGEHVANSGDNDSSGQHARDYSRRGVTNPDAAPYGRSERDIEAGAASESSAQREERSPTTSSDSAASDFAQQIGLLQNGVPAQRVHDDDGGEDHEDVASTPPQRHRMHEEQMQQHQHQQQQQHQRLHAQRSRLGFLFGVFGNIRPSRERDGWRVPEFELQEQDTANRPS